MPDGHHLAVAAFWGYGPDTVQLVCGPLYHTAPSAYAEYSLWEGGQVVVQDGFAGERCLSLIEQHRVTRTQMVPAHFVRILEADWPSYDRSSIRLLIHAAAACPVPLKWRILEVFPRGTVWELYGATEAMGTVISPGEWLLKPGQRRSALPGPLDPHPRRGRAPGCRRARSGTIYVSPFPGATSPTGATPRRPRPPTATASSPWATWATSTQHGYLFIADRRTDLILSGGVNIYPAEVENALAADPDVVDSAVIGLPDERMGQRVHAIVELRPGAAADADVMLDRLAERLADFKRPRTIEFVDTLPREPNGKVLKRQLRQERAARRVILGLGGRVRRCPPAGTHALGPHASGRAADDGGRSPSIARTKDGAWTAPS